MAEITGIQLLRALAAIMVAFGHAQEDAARIAGAEGPYGVHVLPWRAGVDLFFVISGFIMVHASWPLFGQQGAPATFLTRRIVRVAPLYWLCSTAALGLSVLADRLTGRWPLPDLGSILGAYLFWPVDTFGDGIARPFNQIGWTLDYEMFFYVVFALSLGAPARVAVVRTAALLGLAVALGILLRPAQPALVFWSSPIVLEFVLGMGLALAARRVGLGAGTRALLASVGFAVWAFDPLDSAGRPLDWITANDVGRMLAWGVPAACIVAAAVLRPAPEERRPASPAIRAGAAVGDASYALYLLHPFVIVAVRKAWLLAGLDRAVGLAPMIGASLVASLAVALVAHRTVEAPLTRALRSRLAARRSGPAVAPV